jgi:hypothetical protein
MADTFSALVRIDDVNVLALRNGIVGALRLTYITVDAFIGNHQSHGIFLFSSVKAIC